MNTVQISRIRKNVMGTISITMKIKGMRKDQEFIFYPITKDSVSIKIQSDTRIGTIKPNGEGRMSKPHSSGAYFHHLMWDKLTPFQFNESDWKQIVDYIGLTESKEAGKKENGIISSDNSGAKSIFNL